MNALNTRRIEPVLLTSCIAAVTLCITGTMILSNMAGLIRIAPYDNLEARDAAHTESPSGLERAFFRNQISGLPSDEEERVLHILLWTMNQIPAVENGYHKSSAQMVLRGREGKGQLCSGMAQIFRDALLAFDIPARIAILQNGMFSADSHATVEAWIEGRWRLYDPTFHIAMRAAGERIGILQAREWYLKGKGPPVTIEFLGDVAYPARLSSYYIRYDALMTNVYIDLREKSFPRQVYAFPNDGLSTRAQDFYRALYFIVLVTLPALGALTAVALILVRRLRTIGDATEIASAHTVATLPPGE